VQDARGRDALTAKKRAAGSDDFGFYAACVPSLYFWFGTRTAGNGSLVHTPTLAVADDLLIPTAELAVRYVLDLLNP